MEACARSEDMDYPGEPVYSRPQYICHQPSRGLVIASANPVLSHTKAEAQSGRYPAARGSHTVQTSSI